MQAMEAMLSGDESLHTIALPSQSPPFSVKSAFSPLVPPGVFTTATGVGRYPFIQQQHAKRFLAAPYSGTGFLSTIIQSDAEQTDTNGNNTERCGSANESQD